MRRGRIYRHGNTMDRMSDASRMEKVAALRNVCSIKTLLWAVTLGLFALAVVEMRWGLGVSKSADSPSVACDSLAANLSNTEVNEVNKKDSPNFGGTKNGTSPLLTDNGAPRLLPLDKASKLVVSTGFPTQQPVSESPNTPGPELAGPTQSPSIPTLKSPAKKPLAETATRPSSPAPSEPSLPSAVPSFSSSSSPLQDSPVPESVLQDRPHQEVPQQEPAQQRIHFAEIASARAAVANESCRRRAGPGFQPARIAGEVHRPERGAIRAAGAGCPPGRPADLARI